MKLDRKIKLMRLIDILEQKTKLSMIDFWLPFKVHNHENKEKQSYHTEKKKSLANFDQIIEYDQPTISVIPIQKKYLTNAKLQNELDRA